MQTKVHRLEDSYYDDMREWVKSNYPRLTETQVNEHVEIQKALIGRGRGSRKRLRRSSLRLAWTR